MQKIIINGNVGKDPEERFTKNGQKIVSFSLAVSNQDKKKPQLGMSANAGMIRHKTSLCNL